MKKSRGRKAREKKEIRLSREQIGPSGCRQPMGLCESREAHCDFYCVEKGEAGVGRGDSTMIHFQGTRTIIRSDYYSEVIEEVNRLDRK